MKGEVLLLLLKLVKSNGNIQPLVELGYAYNQIVNNLNSLVELNLLSKNDGKFTITENGLTEIERLNKIFNRRSSAAWIEPEIESKIPKIDINDIFLPNPNELSF